MSLFHVIVKLLNVRPDVVLRLVKDKRLVKGARQLEIGLSGFISAPLARPRLRCMLALQFSFCHLESRAKRRDPSSVSSKQTKLKEKDTRAHMQGEHESCKRYLDYLSEY
jgi:hypothetical protein